MDPFDFFPSDHSPGVIPLNTDLPENTTVEEIVVNGERLQRRTPINNNPTVDPMGGPTYAYWTGSLWEPWIPIDKDLADYAFNHANDPLDPQEPYTSTSVPENSADYKNALYVSLLISKAVDTIQATTKTASGSDVIDLGQNNKFFLGDFISTWDIYGFEVTNKIYEAGFGGKSFPTHSEVRFTTIYDPANSNSYYRKGGDAAVIFYEVHEIVHQMPVDKAYHQNLFDLYKSQNNGNGAGFYNSPLGEQAERFTNNGTKGVLEKLGLPVWQGPVYGY